MTNPIIQKLYEQILVRVNAELEKERAVKIQKYLGESAGVLVREGIITIQEAARELAPFGVTSSSIRCRESDYYGSSCPPSQPTTSNNRCYSDIVQTSNRC